VLFLESGGKLVALPGLADSGEFQKITIEVGKLADSIDGLALRNRNTAPARLDHRRGPRGRHAAGRFRARERWSP